MQPAGCEGSCFLTPFPHNSLLYLDVGRYSRLQAGVSSLHEFLCVRLSAGSRMSAFIYVQAHILVVRFYYNNCCLLVKRLCFIFIDIFFV